MRRRSGPLHQVADAPPDPGALVLAGAPAPAHPRPCRRHPRSARRTVSTPDFRLHAPPTTHCRSVCFPPRARSSSRRSPRLGRPPGPPASRPKGLHPARERQVPRRIIRFQVVEEARPAGRPVRRRGGRRRRHSTPTRASSWTAAACSSSPTPPLARSVPSSRASRPRGTAAPSAASRSSPASRPAVRASSPPSPALSSAPPSDWSAVPASLDRAVGTPSSTSTRSSSRPVRRPIRWPEERLPELPIPPTAPSARRRV